VSSEVLKDAKSRLPFLYVHEMYGEVKFIRETWQSWWLCVFPCLRPRVMSWHQNSFPYLRSQVHKYAYFMILCGEHSLQLVFKSVRYLLTHCYKKSGPFVLAFKSRILSTENWDEIRFAPKWDVRGESAKSASLFLKMYVFAYYFSSSQRSVHVTVIRVCSGSDQPASCQSLFWTSS